MSKTTLNHSVPKDTDTKENTQDLPGEQTPDFTGRRLLVAEDYDMNWEICNALLSTYGFTLQWAEDGQKCVDMFNDSEPGYYDAILMDLRMPVMNGYEAAQKIRSLERPDAAVPIIAMTADDFPEDIQRCLECGMNTHITKPIDVKTILSILQEHTGISK